MATINPLAKISPNHIKETAPTTTNEKPSEKMLS
ncbi:Uncharacterised protein [Vibrio cholerae]|nr:Uncharacterised protein [Vibrio cholerae]